MTEGMGMAERGRAEWHRNKLRDDQSSRWKPYQVFHKGSLAKHGDNRSRCFSPDILRPRSCFKSVKFLMSSAGGGETRREVPANRWTQVFKRKNDCLVRENVCDSQASRWKRY